MAELGVNKSSIEQSLEGLNKLVEQLQADLGREVEKHYERFDAQIKEQVSKGIADGMAPVEAKLEKLFGLQVPRMNVLDDGRKHYRGKQGHSGYLPELPFPAFDATDLSSWVWKCDTYFGLYEIAEDQKTPLAVLHLNDLAMTWYQGEKGIKDHIPWDVLKKRVIERFEDRQSESPLVAWKELAHTSIVEDFFGDFQVAKAKLSLLFSNLSESYLVEQFMQKLKEEVSNKFASTPRTLKEALAHAKEYEREIAASK